MRVVVTMPAYRAARTLEKTYRALPPGCCDEVLVVDDASPDETVAVARRLGLPVRRHERNLGYGANQKSCYDWALERGADAVVLLHPDFQYAPERVPALLAPIRAGRADFVFGSRFAAGGRPWRDGMPLHRYLGNRLLTAVENRVLGTDFSELHSGMRAYARALLERIDYRALSDGFVFDSELLIRAVLLGARIEEVPIPTRYDEESSSVGLRDGVAYALGTLAALARARRATERRRGREETVPP